MRVYSLISIAHAVSMVQAGCYVASTGLYGQSMKGADAAADDFCDDDLAGYFTEGQTKYRCFQLPNNKVEFWVGWTGSGGLSLKIDDCKKRLKDEINECSFGGESTVADWYFRVDPNWGEC
ncbi:hypothetical protein IQ07DRAFT_553666 [Pyrenochaeta sp. DS3sAY3a]|nr:hypothetical protein IQ07DRAFT_553666 [Pyrenochaeta sp. DS3sAY3a]